MDFLPKRSVEDIFAGRVRVVSGGQVYDLPVLSIRDNRAWRERLDTGITAILSNLEGAGDNIGTLLETLAGATDELLDLLTSYDKTGVLPPREDLEGEMTDVQALRAVLEVWSAANPLVGIGLATLMTAPPENASPVPTSSPSMNGRASRTRRPSKAA